MATSDQNHDDEVNVVSSKSKIRNIIEWIGSILLLYFMIFSIFSLLIYQGYLSMGDTYLQYLFTREIIAFLPIFTSIITGCLTIIIIVDHIALPGKYQGKMIFKKPKKTAKSSSNESNK